MAEEPSAKRHHGETSNKSSNPVDIHVPSEKREYTKTLKGVELHDKETLEIVCTSIPDKTDEVMSRLRMKGGGLPKRLKDFLQEEKLYTFVGFSIGGDKRMLEKSGGVIHPFYEGMKKKMDRADHKLWGTSPLPNNLITYAGIDAYATYKSWKTIDNIVTG
ncbi:unnamed protein product [Triticum turgidum subsp. durum]|uniref:3'-5' exonuclease domain-containing protein n=1 Tax=Triticum turgidum subsp. durum TaxID=4567 RepID=A0A9R0X9Y5_TRITD|nr:unnamed protein product [Triticum turgidum subsp. durum]